MLAKIKDILSRKQSKVTPPMAAVGEKVRVNMEIRLAIECPEYLMPGNLRVERMTKVVIDAAIAKIQEIQEEILGFPSSVSVNIQKNPIVINKE